MSGETMAHRSPAQRSRNMLDRRRKAPQMDLFASDPSIDYAKRRLVQ